MQQQDIRIAPAFAARILGFAVVALGLAILVLVVVATLADLSAGVTVVVAAVGLFAIGVTGLYLVNRAVALRITDQGYRLRYVRGAGVTRARWGDVEDAVTTYVADAPCVVLRLRDGGSTTIPVEILAIDRERLVAVLQEALERGSGLKRLR
ncbi:hypothetical protein RDV89_09170 [Nocardioides zeae]|uniref:PH domain-containing protein n=1 Tax=Nocardioides imazamoxiresistens TaxID=3231893 RepID=A0ABU3PVH6_9ACTN|nr:hypothetical protein [Nocardioides zeae]MDT9593237.1 hypothetical protein [Nocardioides zeae]